MKLYLLIASYFSIVISGLNTTKAIAQTTFSFEATYDTEVIFEPIPNTSGIAIVTVLGETDEAPFDLTNLESSNYSQIDPVTGEFTFNADPATFGLEGFDVLSDVFFGGNQGQLFGTSSGSGFFNFAEGEVTGSGTITVTGGTGIFQGATGTFSFDERETLAPVPVGEAIVTGFLQIPQAVPEPSTNAILIGLGVLGGASLLRRR